MIDIDTSTDIGILNLHLKLWSSFISVDLPEPLEPTKNTNSPFSMCIEISLTPAEPFGYTFDTCSILIKKIFLSCFLGKNKL